MSEIPEAGHRLGFAVVTYGLASGRPFAGFLLDSQADAEVMAGTAKTGPGERHIVAEVVTPGRGSGPDDNLRRRFAQLRDAWHAATAIESDVQRIVLDLSYQQIIGLGPRVIPLILEDLAGPGGHWFWALTVIAGNDEARGQATTEGARQAWLRWGRQQGLIPRTGRGSLRGKLAVSADWDSEETNAGIAHEFDPEQAETPDQETR